MPLFDAQTGEYNDGAFAYDTHGMMADQPSIFDSVSNLITKAVPLTGLSIVNSFANTGIQVANFFGADLDQWTIDKEMSSLGLDDYADYYKAHQEGIEGAGLVLGSLIPGLGAIKGMQAINAMKMAKAGSMTGILQRATGIFSRPRAAILENAAAEMADKGSLFNSISTDKFKAIALGFGDQALQALAYETAVAGTMKASPLLDEQSLGDTLTNMFYGAIIGGGIGGVVEGIGANAFLNRAKLNIDTSTKAAQLTSRPGYIKGAQVDNTSLSSDRVISLLDSMDKIPVDPDNALLSKTAQATKDAAVLAAKKELQNLVPEGSEDLTNAAFDFIYKTYQSGDKEQAYDYLAQLAKISRVDTPASVPTGDTFYLQRFVTPREARTFDEIATTTPQNVPGVIEQRYQLAPYTDTSKIGIVHEWDVIPGTGPNAPTPTTTASFYRTSSEAFGNGADIFVNAKGFVTLNPNSENIIGKIARPGESRPLTLAEEKLRGTVTDKSGDEYTNFTQYPGQLTKSLPEKSRPLYGAPVTLRVTDGSVMTKVVPVIGDYGVPSINPRGIEAGNKFSAQSMNTPLNENTNSLDATARYVWAAKRGLKNGDIIEPTDIPMMEQLYREAIQGQTDDSFRAAMASFEKRGIKIQGQDLPNNRQQLLNSLRGSKDDLIQELIQNQPELSSEEIARRANVPEKYISNQFGATQPSDYMTNPADLMKVNHVQLEYDIGNIYQQDGNILRGLLSSQYRINIIKDAAEATFTKKFGPDSDKFLIKSFSSKDATITGTGPGLFTFSNSNYGTFGQAAERVGRFFTNWINERQAAIADFLTPAASALRADPVAAAEASMFTAVRRRTGEAFTFLPDDLAVKYGVAPGNGRAVLTNSLIKDKAGNIVDWNQNYTPPNYLPGIFETNQAGEIQTGNLHTFYDLSPKVVAWEKANLALNDTRLSDLKDWYAAQGINKDIQTGNLYAPPIDTKQYPFFAFIKARPGTAMSDDGVAVITARTEADLNTKISSLKDDYSVYTKEDLKTFHQVQGDYDFSRNFAQARVNNDLRRRGILNDIYPPTNAENLISDMVNFHNRQEIRQGRDYIELGNAQLFAEVRAMGDRFKNTATSQSGYIPESAGRGLADNPYNSYIRTALGLNDTDSYSLWHQAQEKLEAFGDTAFNMAKSAFYSAKAGVISYEDASAMAEKFGLGNPYSAATDALSAYYNIANKLPPSRILSKFVSTANSILSSATIRLDAFQSLINVISSPILMSAEFNSAKDAIANGALTAKNLVPGSTNDLLTTAIPNSPTGQLLPSSLKSTYQAVSNWFNEDVRNQWLPVYKQMGIVRESSSEYFKMIDALRLPYGNIGQGAIAENLQKAVDLGAKVSGSQYSENFARFVAADVARQLFSAGGATGTDLLDQIGTFVNRVHGNYVGSQRPIAFQGPVGQAMSLFQTYQFNLMQQLFRYVENGEGKSLAILAGLQTTIFGMQGLPGFQMINQHLAGNLSGNPGHKDIYSGVSNLMDPAVGNYLLYGVASNWMQSGLYSRGDINPRQISVLPLNPLDFPAISGGINFITNILDTADKIKNGANVKGAFLLGLEHNGISRPLAGLGQLMQGYVTNQAGNLVSATNPNSPLNTPVDLSDPQKYTSGWNDVISLSNFGRLLGARPLDEALAMDAMYRRTVYLAKDNTRIQDLGEAAKTWLYDNGQMPSNAVQDFAAKYSSMGGYAPRFGQEMMKWSQDANVSTANQIYRQLNKPINQEIMKQMGGQRLPDFIGTGSTAGSVGPQSSLDTGNSGRQYAGDVVPLEPARREEDRKNLPGAETPEEFNLRLLQNPILNPPRRGPVRPA